MPKNISATILADSTFDGKRLTTVEVQCPHHTWVHLLTHRCLSRNAQSARAIPTAKLIERATYTPERWFYAAKGMQPGEEITDPAKIRDRVLDWDNLRNEVTATAETLAISGVSKETVNRLLQPFSLITGIVTATDAAWNSVFRLRCTPETQWETRELFQEIANKRLAATPSHTHFHAPYTDDLGDEYTEGDKMMISAARCARVSYLTHDGERSVDKDIELAHRLLKDRHASPFEHQARAIIDTPDTGWGNFDRPWYQHRKELEKDGLI